MTQLIVNLSKIICDGRGATLVQQSETSGCFCLTVGLCMSQVPVFGLLGLLLVLLVLQVCVAVTASVFSGKALRRQTVMATTVS